MLYITEEEIERKIFVHFLRTGEILEPRYFEIKSIQNKEIDFMEEIVDNKTLFVGEGNLSFSLSLAQSGRLNYRNLTASVFETESEVLRFALFNALKLELLGVKVLYEINATNLKRTFGNELFDCIIFQFPNVASREPIKGRNPNYILLANFLISARFQLNPRGKVIISLVDSSYYKGAFGIDDLYYITGYNEPLIYSFNPSKIKGYVHAMTHKEENALEKYDKFMSLVFTLKQE